MFRAGLYVIILSKKIERFIVLFIMQYWPDILYPPPRSFGASFFFFIFFFVDCGGGGVVISVLLHLPVAQVSYWNIHDLFTFSLLRRREA